MKEQIGISTQASNLSSAMAHSEYFKTKQNKTTNKNQEEDRESLRDTLPTYHHALWQNTVWGSLSQKLYSHLHALGLKWEGSTFLAIHVLSLVWRNVFLQIHFVFFILRA